MSANLTDTSVLPDLLDSFKSEVAKLKDGDQINTISAVASVIAAITAIITLFGVYVAALQLSSQRRIAREGSSYNALGPWRATVRYSSFLNFQQRIYAPQISVSQLIKKNWEPWYSYPTGIQEDPSPSATGGSWNWFWRLMPQFSRGIRGKEGNYELASNSNVANEAFQADTSWVNFVQALNIKPQDTDLYRLRLEPGNFNGVIPMHWKGYDLVTIAGTLGFQARGEPPSHSSPMPLPLIWSGPLGLIFFRSSVEGGCIAEFQVRPKKPPIFPKIYHEFFNTEVLGSKKVSLAARICYSLDTFYVPRIVLVKDEIDGKPIEKKVNSIFRVQWDSEGYDYNSELDEVITKCPGLLADGVVGGLLTRAGISLEYSLEFTKTYKREDEIDKDRFRYRLGNKHLDRETLELFKTVVMTIQPDGFFFCGGNILTNYMLDIYRTPRTWQDRTMIYGLEECGKNSVKGVFPVSKIDDWDEDTILFNIAEILNIIFRLIDKKGVVRFNLDDVILVMKCSLALEDILRSEDSKGRGGLELHWAFIVCPEFFDVVAKLLSRIKSTDIKSLLRERDALSIQEEELEFLHMPKELLFSVLDTEGLTPTNSTLARPSHNTTTSCAIQNRKFHVPLSINGTFSGRQLIAAYMSVCVTSHWIEEGWPTNLEAYHMTIPPSVLMF